MSTRLRSLMYVPANRQRMLDRALGFGEFTPGALDVAILDLEDGTPAAERDIARANVAALLGRPSNGGAGPLRFVRINGVTAGSLDADLRSAVRAGLAGIVVPKIERAEEVLQVAARLDRLEQPAGLRAESIALYPSIETALGIINAHSIASASPRVGGLVFGMEDYTLDLGLPAERVGAARDLVYARSAIVNAAIAARVEPIDGVWAAVPDLVGLRSDTELSRQLGFTGRSLIHPSHTEVINELYSPSQAEVTYARRVLEAFDAAQARGEGAVALDGAMLDRPVVERARRTIALVS